MSTRVGIYQLLAATGLIVPWYFNLQWIAAGGGFHDVPGLVRLAFANAISSSFSADLFIAFLAFVVFAVAEGRRRGMAHAWVYPLAGLLISFAFAFPLFLLMRERKLASEGGT